MDRSSDAAECASLSRSICGALSHFSKLAREIGVRKCRMDGGRRGGERPLLLRLDAEEKITSPALRGCIL